MPTCNSSLPLPHLEDEMVTAALQLFADCMRWRFRRPRLLFAPKETYCVVEAVWHGFQPEWRGHRECRICRRLQDSSGVFVLLNPINPRKEWFHFWICERCIVDNMDPKVLNELRFGITELPLPKPREEKEEDDNGENPLKVVVFRVRLEYYDQIYNGTKNVELRKESPFWRKRLLGPRPPSIALFLCGSGKLYRRIVEIRADQDPEAILGRPLSAQGKKDIPTPKCFAIYLGERVDPPSRLIMRKSR